MNRNRMVRVRGEIRRWAIALSELPSLRTATMMALESLAHPRNETPISSHKMEGVHPHRLTPVITPTMGPAAAIDLKWYPYNTFRLAGMKSTPSLYIRAGVARLGSA